MYLLFTDISDMVFTIVYHCKVSAQSTEKIYFHSSKKNLFISCHISNVCVCFTFRTGMGLNIDWAIILSYLITQAGSGQLV